MTEEAVRQAFMDWLADVWALAISEGWLVSDALTVGVAQTGGPKLARPCALVHIPNHGAAGGRPVERVNGSDQIEYRRHSRDTIEVHVITSGPGKDDWDGKAFPMEILEIARDSIAIPSHKEGAADDGIAIVEMRDPVDNTAALATRYEAGATAEFVVAYRRSIVDTSAGSIERIIGTVDMDGIDASVDVT